MNKTQFIKDLKDKDTVSAPFREIQCRGSR